MNPRQKSAFLWGFVGAFGFLTLHQAYLLIGGEFLGVGPIAGITVVVAAVTAVAAYYAERRLGMAARRFRREGE
jgi:hypothetical protein